MELQKCGHEWIGCAPNNSVIDIGNKTYFFTKDAVFVLEPVKVSIWRRIIRWLLN